MVIEVNGELNFDGQSTVNLDCYSYQVREFDSVIYVLKRSDATYTQTPIAPDQENRTGSRFTLVGQNYKKVENFLNISFFASRSGNDLKGSGAPYSCRRMDVLGNSNDCKTIYADNDYSANVICAIVARKSRWFSGTASPGGCKE